MHRHSRPALVLCVLAAAATIALAAGATGSASSAETSLPCTGCTGFTTGQPLREPNRLVSVHGKLEATLTAGMSTVDIGGKTVRSQVYNGQLPASTIVVSPGDQLNVLLRNRLVADYLPYGASSLDPPPVFPGQPYAGFSQPLGNPTNLHVHGLHVSPKTPSDNVFLSIAPGGQFRYRYTIPRSHPAGLFWYHPHHHEYVDMQVSQGQAGAIIVRGGLDEVPGIKGLRDRLMVLQNVEVKDGAVTSGQYQVPAYRLITINGQVQPQVGIRPGESQRWRLLNASTERFLRIVLPSGGARMWRLATDGATLQAPIPLRQVWLAPGQRMEVLVRAGTGRGSFPIVQTAFNQRPTPYGEQPRVQIATLRVGGEAVAPQPVPRRLLPIRDLRGPNVKVARTRLITLTQSPPEFYVNGKMFHHHGDTMGPTFTARLGTIEDWTLWNNSPEWHNFHLHVDDYQLIARNGKPVTGQPRWADSIAIPPGAKLTVRIPFEEFPGTFVFHCHVLVHEDHGMMAIVKVVGPGGS